MCQVLILQTSVQTYSTSNIPENSLGCMLRVLKVAVLKTAPYGYIVAK